MKYFTTLLILLSIIGLQAQDVGINISNPSERLHILDNGPTKVLLRTTNGTAFFVADSPSNSGFLFRTNGSDRANLFYSPFSDMLSANVGSANWALFSNGDFRVKERIFTGNTLKLDAPNAVVIEVNGTTISIDDSGTINITGENVTVNANNNFVVNANNIALSANGAVNITAGGNSDIDIAGALAVTSGGDMSIASGEDVDINSSNFGLTTNKAIAISSGTNTSLSALNLAINASINTNFITGGSFEIAAGVNYELNSGGTISQSATGEHSLMGLRVLLNGGTKPFARVGDIVSIPGVGIGSIISGSGNVLGN